MPQFRLFPFHRVSLLYISIVQPLGLVRQLAQSRQLPRNDENLRKTGRKRRRSIIWSIDRVADYKLSFSRSPAVDLRTYNCPDNPSAKWWLFIISPRNWRFALSKKLFSLFANDESHCHLTYHIENVREKHLLHQTTAIHQLPVINREKMEKQNPSRQVGSDYQFGVAPEKPRWLFKNICHTAARRQHRLAPEEHSRRWRKQWNQEITALIQLRHVFDKWATYFVFIVTSPGGLLRFSLTNSPTWSSITILSKI